jgi:hypothetical protein
MTEAPRVAAPGLTVVEAPRDPLMNPEVATPPDATPSVETAEVAAPPETGPVADADPAVADEPVPEPTLRPATTADAGSSPTAELADAASDPARATDAPVPEPIAKPPETGAMVMAELSPAPAEDPVAAVNFGPVAPETAVGTDPLVAPALPSTAGTATGDGLATATTAPVPDAATAPPPAPEPAEAVATIPEVGAATDAPTASSAGPALPETAVTDPDPATSDAPPPMVAVAPSPTPDASVVAEVEPEENRLELPQIAAPADPTPPPAAPGDVQPEAANVPETLAVGDNQSTLPSAPGFSDEVAGVKVNRLPRIGDTPTPTTEEPPVVPEDQPPLIRFASAFENPEARPVMAIVLLDDGISESDRASVVGLPFPVSVALDPTAPGAPEAAAEYVAAGREVIMLAEGIPEGANASDLEVTFQAHASTLPEAVAVMDIEVGGFQANRPLATLVAPVVKGQGRGLITWDKGLNAGDQVARREGMSAGLVFRRIDPEGSDTAAIRRTLDKAAFKAGQAGRTIVVGKADPETLSALMEWALEGRGATLALAPVTAALTVPD